MRTPGRALVGVSAILLCLLALVGARAAWQNAHRNPLGELAAAVGSDLDLEPRLTGGFLPRAETAARRSGTTPAGDRLSPDARIAIARLEKLAAADESPRALAAVAVAYLVAGDVDRSIATLEDVTSLADAAASWSDLSAAYLVKAERTPARRIEYLARALDATSRSLRAGPTGEARFNRSLALDALAPYVESTGVWDDYLRTERDSRWLEAARRRAAAPVKRADVRALWDERRKLLTARLEAHDRPFIVETATRFPEATLEFFEQELLVEWARAATSGDERGATATLGRARELGSAWSAATRDPMLQEIAQRMTSLSGSAAGAQALARAHLAYRDAVIKYRADDYDASTASTDAALAGFSRADTPFWTWAALQKGIILFQRGQRDRADAELAPVEALARRRGYRTLLGRTLRQRGLTQSKLWRIDEALRLFEEAAACFEDAGEQESAAVVYSQIADMLRTLGERHASWEYIGKTLDGLSRMRMPLQRYLALYNASLFASSQDLFDAALLFQNAAVREAMLRGGGPVVEGLIVRATILTRQKDDDHALQDLRDADTRLQALPDGPLKHYHQAEIDVLSAELSQTGRVQPNIAGLRQAISFFSSTEPALLPRLHLALARAHLRAHADDDAERAFEQGIVQLEGQQSRLGDEAFKISYFDESWSLFPEMIQFQMDVRHNVERAFAYADRSRARSLMGVTSVAEPRAATLQAVQRALPDGVVLLYYVTLSDRLLAWSVTNRGHELFETRVQRDQLGRLASQFRSDVSERRGQAIVAGAQLSELLIRPVVRTLTPGATLVFVTDADLQQVPFAALTDSGSGRYLIEDHPVLLSPSASFFVAGLAHSRQLSGQPMDSALLVGNPAPDTTAAGLKALPGAESEVVETAALYARHLVLTGRTATKGRFVEAAPAFDVVHFGGHALVNAEYPLMSRLLFAPEPGTGRQQPLFAHEISRIHLPRTRLVVLAACSTAAGTVSRGEGVVSVARPFLAAGVPIVVASQWDVDDRATEQLFLAFHRALVESHDAVAALRVAQLSLLRGPNPAFAVPGSWSAFVALGTVAR